MAFGHFKRFLGSESAIGTDRVAFKKATEQVQSIVSRSADTLANSAESIIGTSRPALEAATSQLSATATQSADLLANSAESIIGTSRPALEAAASELGGVVAQSGDLLANSADSVIGTSRQALEAASAELAETVEKSADVLANNLDDIQVLPEVVVKDFKIKSSTPKRKSHSKIQEFSSSIRDAARPNLFQVIIHFPAFVASTKEGSYLKYAEQEVIGDIISGGGATRRLQFTCEQAMMPGRAIQSDGNKTYGMPRKIARSVSYADMAMTFMIGSDMKEKKLFEVWQQSIFDPRTQNMNYYNEYTSTVQIYQFNRKYEYVYGVTLRDAYPSIIGDVNLSSEATDTYHRLPVTFSYREWVEIDVEKEWSLEAEDEPGVIDAVKERIPQTFDLHGDVGQFPDTVPPEYRAAVGTGQFTYTKEYGLQRV